MCETATFAEIMSVCVCACVCVCVCVLASFPQTLHAHTLLFVSVIPGLHLAGLTAVEHLMAATAGHQHHTHGAAALVAVLKRLLPAKDTHFHTYI